MKEFINLLYLQFAVIVIEVSGLLWHAALGGDTRGTGATLAEADSTSLYLLLMLPEARVIYNLSSTDTLSQPRLPTRTIFACERVEGSGSGVQGVVTWGWPVLTGGRCMGTPCNIATIGSGHDMNPNLLVPSSRWQAETALLFYRHPVQSPVTSASKSRHLLE